jgi:hypothetical protein
MQVGEGYLEAHGGSIAIPTFHMAGCDRFVVSRTWDLGHWCLVFAEVGIKVGSERPLHEEPGEVLSVLYRLSFLSPD